MKFRLSKTTIDIPTLFIEAANDSVLKPEMSRGMERYVTSLSRRTVKASHWVSHDLLIAAPITLTASRQCGSDQVR